MDGYFIFTGGNGYLNESIRTTLLLRGLAHHLLELPLSDENQTEGEFMRLACNLGFLRNYLLVASADYIIASGGGAGHSVKSRWRGSYTNQFVLLVPSGDGHSLGPGGWIIVTVAELHMRRP